MTGSLKMISALICLGLWCVNEAHGSNSTWIIQPAPTGGGGGRVGGPLVPRNNTWPVEPRNLRTNTSILEPRVNYTIMPKEADLSEVDRVYGRSLDCGTYILQPGQTETIQSMNYPRRYPRNARCTWTFQASSPDSRISITCQDFVLRGCRFSSVKITGAGLDVTYCGKKSGLSETSLDNNMQIYFRANKSKRRKRGFTCDVTASAVEPATTSTTRTTTTSTTRTTTTSTTSSTSLDTSCKSCGTVNRVTRIVGGVETEVNEYPWQAALVYAGTSDVFCGGSILNDRFILTAAHCIAFIRSNNIATEVLLGAHDLSSPTSSQQRIPVDATYIHSSYDSSTLDNDIGFVRIQSPASLNDNVKPVCLPDPSKDYDGVLATTSGWGTLYHDGPQPDILNEIDVPTMTNAVCDGYYPGWVTANMICAGFPQGGKDSCQGDSGGPLVVEDNGKWVIVGVTSWGSGCADPNAPGVYARVTQYVGSLVGAISSGSNNLCGSTLSPASTVSTEAPPTPPPTGCKCGRKNVAARIVGGVPTEIHEYPWQVGLTSISGSRPYCGGSIISDQWIMTAAHCVQGDQPSYLRVVIGEHRYTSTSETSATERRTASQIIVHQNYNRNTLHNDIALIKLTSPIVFPADNKIAPVCLPLSAANLYSNVDAVVTGWGTLSSGGSQPSELYEVTVPTMTNAKCASSYGSSITANMICAGFDEGGKDSCQGDSGGPLVTAGNTAETFMEQIGIVSWGSGCALAGRPGVYTRVANYLDWMAGYTSGSTTCPRP